MDHSDWSVAERGQNLLRTVLQIPHGLWGMILIAVFWPLNWLLPGLRTAYLFFPLWLGYVLTVDALVLARTGTSLLTRSRRDFVLLFVLSAPTWWIFEIINSRTQNWEYLGRGHFTGLEYFILCSLSFSTVMLAVFETAELVQTFSWTGRLSSGPRILRSPQAPPVLFVSGLMMLAALWTWPRYFYPFVWLSLAFLLEPVNLWSGRRHLLEHLRHGDWRVVISLSLGTLICGFFWEMWNYHSYPKWVYHTPGVEFLHIFEMPLLGYGGYLPFAWELYGLRNLAWRNTHSFRV